MNRTKRTPAFALRSRLSNHDSSGPELAPQTSSATRNGRTTNLRQAFASSLSAKLRDQVPHDLASSPAFHPAIRQPCKESLMLREALARDGSDLFDGTYQKLNECHQQLEAEVDQHAQAVETTQVQLKRAYASMQNLLTPVAVPGRDQRQNTAQEKLDQLAEVLLKARSELQDLAKKLEAAQQSETESCQAIASSDAEIQSLKKLDRSSASKSFKKEVDNVVKDMHGQITEIELAYKNEVNTLTAQILQANMYN